MIRIVTTSRLEYEKGIDLLIDAYISLPEIARDSMCIDVLGDGTLRDTLQQKIRDNNAGGRVRFHGNVSSSEVTSFLKSADFLCMPSRFIETFGLGAAEAVLASIPVIAFSQKGFDQFCFGELLMSYRETDRENIHTLSQMLVSLANIRIEPERIESYAKMWGEKLSSETWLRSFRSCIPQSTSRILIVSDFTAPIGGIEAHIHHANIILSSAGYATRIVGSRGASSRMRRISALLALCNLPFAVRLYLEYMRFRPDVIWIHSLSRFVGPLGLVCILTIPARHLLTVHDFGVMTAFPSRLTSLSALSISRSRFFFSTTFSPLSYFLALGKWLYVDILSRLYRRLDTIIVPSEYLKPIVSTWGSFPSEKVEVIYHPVK